MLHVPVLLEEVLTFLSEGCPQSGVVLDCTLGGGGHAGSILKRLPGLGLVGLDRDAAAIARLQAAWGMVFRQEMAGDRKIGEVSNSSSEGSSEVDDEQADYQRISSEKLVMMQAGFGKFATDFASGEVSSSPRFAAVRELFSRCGSTVECGFARILVDAGISSIQLDDPSRGFSFSSAGPLDMRMDRSQSLTADTVLNSYAESELIRVFRVGGVGVDSAALARAVCHTRPFGNSGDFASFCRSFYTGKRLRVSLSKRKAKASGGDDGRSGVGSVITQLLAVVFQAIRIETNQEFDELRKLMDAVPRILAPGGRLLAISFHSGEDEIVTARMRELSREPEGAVRLPLRGVSPFGRLLTKKPITPSVSEVRANPRARSARLRVFERLA